MCWPITHLSCAGDRAMLTYPGCIAALKVQEIDFSLLQQARHLHVGSFFLQTGIREGLQALFPKAKEEGLTVSLDPGWDPEDTWDGGLSRLLGDVDIFLPNENEALSIARRTKVEDALALLACHVPMVVVKLGAEGAIARAGQQVERVGTFAVEVVDTIGAGDSFDAGFLYGYLNKMSLFESLRIGCACGALSTTKVGGVAGQPDLKQVEALLRLG
ncbi:MAG: carbohydrate kinase family protein [Anaerolineae bacterium]